ncbi:hypothetical protein C8Q78DRAFT_1041627 [Trametes maxima]|nr:hypothetical protein C8Q78DRAFT_1041627 [Trametes maxima]
MHMLGNEWQSVLQSSWTIVRGRFSVRCRPQVSCKTRYRRPRTERPPAVAAPRTTARDALFRIGEPAEFDEASMPMVPLTPAHLCGPEHAMLWFSAMTFACWGSIGAGVAEIETREKETARRSVRVWMARAYIVTWMSVSTVGQARAVGGIVMRGIRIPSVGMRWCE